MMKLYYYVENILKDSTQFTGFSILLLFLIILYYLLRNKDVPPGPWGIPFLGYYPFLKSQDVHLQLQDFMGKYGDIYSFKVTGKLYIHLGSIKAVRDAYVTHSDCFTRRNTGFTLLTCFFTEGVGAANDEQWKVLRKFFTQAFRDSGLSSSKEKSAPIYDSLNIVIGNLRAANAKPIELMSLLSEPCSDVLRRMLFNDEGVTTEELLEIMESYGKVLEAFLDKRVLLTGNFAKYVLLPFTSGYKESLRTYKKLHTLLIQIIKRHSDTLDEQSLRNIIDSYLQQRNYKESKGDPSSKYFTDLALVSSLLQFLGDGILGVAEFISQNIYSLLEYPDEQDKIYKELMEIIGPNRQPQLEDKNNLPYTNAFMLEVNRLSELFTFFPSLECTKETILEGYRIPKGSITVTNFYTSHRDPTTYEEPYVFKPSRFLKKLGQKKAEPPILFGVGKRSCIGEPFAMMQAFLFLTTIVKNFRLAIPEGVSLRTFKGGQIEVVAYPRMNN